MRTKVLSAILSLCMIFTIMPITAFAADVTEHDLSTGSITIARNGNYLITQSNSETATYYTITVEAETANITIKDINIEAGYRSAAFSIGSNSSVELTISGTNTLTGGYGYAGFWVPTGASVTIQSTDGSADDSLTAEGGKWGAGIGGSDVDETSLEEATCGTVNIKSGNITAEGGIGGAGIGGGYSGNGGNITISAEEDCLTTVTAKGGFNGGAGIGGGSDGDCGKIKITGSTVVAKGDYIGIGSWNGVGSIDIIDSTIIATGSSSAIYAEEVTFDYNVDYLWRTDSTDKFTDSGDGAYEWDDAHTYLEIQIPVTGIELDMTALALNVGDSEALTATITPESASDKTIIWTSSDEAVATVDENGQVVAVGVGEATITVTSGEMTATCEITVTEPTPEETNGITGFLRMIKMILELIIYIFGLFAG